MKPNCARLELAFKQLQGFQGNIFGLPKVPLIEVGRRKVEISRHLQRNFSKRLGKRPAVLSERDRLAQTSGDHQGLAHMHEQLAESPLVVESPGRTLGFSKTDDDPLKCSEWKE